MNKKQTNNKLTKKDYISKYIFLKILFGEFGINDYVYSESKMSEYFNTTNITVRSAYNNLIQKGILKAIKGKGYIVLKNIGSYMFDHYQNLEKLKYKKEKNNFYFFLNEKKIISLKYESRLIFNDNDVKNLLDIFKIIFSKLEFDEIILNKHYLFKEKFLTNIYNYYWNDEIVLSITLKSDINYIELFNYYKYLTLN